MLQRSVLRSIIAESFICYAGIGAARRSVLSVKRVQAPTRRAAPGDEAAASGARHARLVPAASARAGATGAKPRPLQARPLRR